MALPNGLMKRCEYCCVVVQLSLDLIGFLIYPWLNFIKIVMSMKLLKILRLKCEFLQISTNFNEQLMSVDYYHWPVHLFYRRSLQWLGKCSRCYSGLTNTLWTTNGCSFFSTIPYLCFKVISYSFHLQVCMPNPIFFFERSTSWSIWSIWKR